MRLAAAMVLIGAWLPARLVQGDDSFPYKAYVTTAEAYVRSGPAERYYPTDRLRIGDEVEVYRHDPGGWCAIRPPEGSFSWLSGRHLEGAGVGVARVVTDAVPARVGSRFSDIRSLAQIRLQKGEKVEVLEEKDFPDGPDGGRWYMISPQAGEFRWVEARCLDRTPPPVSAPVSESSPIVLPHPVAVEEITPTPAPKPADPSPPPASAPPAPPSAPGWRAPTAEPAAAGASAPSSSTEATPPAAAPPVVNRAISPEEFQVRLDQLDLDLSLMLVEEPTVWHFGDLETRARELLAQAETPLERGRSSTLVAKIEASEDLKSRYDLVAMQRTNAAPQAPQVAAASTVQTPIQVAPQVPVSSPTLMGALKTPPTVTLTVPSASVATAANGTAAPSATVVAPPTAAASLTSAGRFDGTGRLARVVSPKVGAPQYALVDDQGQVRCYVTPAPGVNMQYYVGRQIGVNGVRGTITDQQSQHVMAKHITSLDSTLVR